MGEYDQHYAAVCGNGHANTQYLDHPVGAGTGAVPKRCPECGATMFTHCECGAPVLGHRSTRGVTSVNTDPPPWFCEQCGKPFIWATREGVRTWVENRLRFDVGLDADTRYDLLDVLALLTPGYAAAPPTDFSGFEQTLKKLPVVYAEVKPFLPVLRDLFT